MAEETHTVRELKRRHAFKCLWGKCKDCSRVVDGKGIHDVEVYQVFECTEDDECGRCNGDGYTHDTCPECGGSGEIEEKCLDCNGKGRVPDELGERKLIKEVDVLVKKEVSVDSSHN